MPKYLVEVRYAAEGAAGLAREGGSARRVAAARTVESAGGKLEAIYFAFGDVVDAYMIIDSWTTPPRRPSRLQRTELAL
jgi:uncharacterized protein with GYD domain